MKLKHLLPLLALLPLTPLHAEDKHDHEGKIRGPHGGRVVEIDDAHAEIYITPERTVAVYFFDEDMKPLPVSGASGEVIAQAAARKKLALAPKDDALVSADALPAGDNYQLVVRLKPTADAKFQNIRFTYVEGTCSGCHLGEYACVCEGHDH